MADKLKDHTTATGVKDGYQNSEHELEVSGMRSAPEDRQRRRDSYSKAEIDENVVVHELNATKRTEREKREQAAAGGGYVHRTPESMSLQEELEHLPEWKKQKDHNEK
jgi:hypothetical protein